MAGKMSRAQVGGMHPASLADVITREAYNGSPADLGERDQDGYYPAIPGSEDAPANLEGDEPSDDVAPAVNDPRNPHHALIFGGRARPGATRDVSPRSRPPVHEQVLQPMPLPAPMVPEGDAVDLMTGIAFFGGHQVQLAEHEIAAVSRILMSGLRRQMREQMSMLRQEYGKSVQRKKRTRKAVSSPRGQSKSDVPKAQKTKKRKSSASESTEG